MLALHHPLVVFAVAVGVAVGVDVHLADLPEVLNGWECTLVLTAVERGPLIALLQSGQRDYMNKPILTLSELS